MAGFQFVNGRYVIRKDPRAELDYGVRMSRWLVPGDSIDPTFAPMWQTSDGLEVLAEAVIESGKTAMVKLGGGVLGDVEWSQCTWRTTQGRIERVTLWFSMVDK